MQSRMPADYQIPDDPDHGKMDASYLRSCLGLRAKAGEQLPELPDSVRRAHYDMARSLSIMGVMGRGMDPTQLAVVIAMALREGTAITEHEPEYAFPVNEAIPGQKVVIRWRNKDQPAHFLKARDGKVVVLQNGNEVKMSPENVRFPEDGEFPDVDDNINQQQAV